MTDRAEMLWLDWAGCHVEDSYTSPDFFRRQVRRSEQQLEPFTHWREMLVEQTRLKLRDEILHEQ
jgi:hypothetical protein